MNQAELAALKLAYMVDALTFALGALDLVDQPHDSTLRQLQFLAEVHQELEASAATLLIADGTSWGALARQLGVTRQSSPQATGPQRHRTAQQGHGCGRTTPPKPVGAAGIASC
jgi:hypothetical protein